MPIPDKCSAGRSRIVPYIPGQSRSESRLRRKQTNLDLVGDARAWCSKRGITLDLKNGGEHWIFRHVPSRHMAEWWPSSAKLVLDKDWNKGVRAHDWEQVARVIEERWLHK